MIKKIWILNHYGGPPNITNAIRHYSFAKNLKDKGHDVKVFVASSSHSGKGNIIKDKKKFLCEAFDGVPFLFIRTSSYFGNGRKRIQNMIEYTFRVYSVAKKLPLEKPDIIFASSVHPLTWIAGYRLAKKYRAKFIAETRDLWPETLIAMGKIKKNSMSAKVLYQLEKFIYKKADKLIFTMEGGKDYVQKLGIDHSKVTHINNGIDMKMFYDHAKNHEYKDEYIDQEGVFKILYTGSMGRANAVESIVSAAKKIQEKGIMNIVFILYGDGYERKELEANVYRNKVKNVIFKGMVEKKYVPSILKKADLNIFTGQQISLYQYGISPNKLFEYMASGKPIISNVECGYDIIEKFKCGLTVKERLGEDLTDGILKFYYMSKVEYQTYCTNALKASVEYDFKELSEKLEKLFLEA